jgi:hypothetical protein
MSSIFKTLILLLSVSVLLFALFLSLDKEKKKVTVRVPEEVMRKNQGFREFFYDVKIEIFRDIDRHWCMKFNCQSARILEPIR